jgi:hypothetical protein
MQRINTSLFTRASMLKRRRKGYLCHRRTIFPYVRHVLSSDQTSFLPATTFPPKFQGAIKHEAPFPFRPGTPTLSTRTSTHSSCSALLQTNHWIYAADGRHVELEVKGGWWDRSANITCGGQPVAHISRSYFNMSKIFGTSRP